MIGGASIFVTSEDSPALATASRHSSESNEHYTPIAIVEAARKTLGAIDLDPASCDEANEVVRAELFYGPNGRRANGFREEWYGRVFLNPPGGKSDDQERPVMSKCRETGSCGLPIGHTHTGVESSQKKWWFKLAREWLAGNVEAAIFVSFSVELLQTTQANTPTLEDSASGAAPLPIPLEFAICYPAKRLAYRRPGGEIGTSPPHASAIILVALPRPSADDWNASLVSRFVKHFSPIGRVVVPA